MFQFSAAIRILTTSERRDAGQLLLLTILIVFLDVAGVASVMPFLSLIAEPNVIETNGVLSYLNGFLGFPPRERFVLIFGFGVFGVLVLSAVFRTFGQYRINIFVQMLVHGISVRLLETYMRQPYEFFLNRHTGDMAKGLLSETGLLISYIYRPVVILISQSILLVCLIALMVVVDPRAAVMILVGLGLLYGAIYSSFRPFVGRVGRQMVKANKARFQLAADTLGGVKPLRVAGGETIYLNEFQNQSYKFAKYRAINATLAQTPRYSIEALAFGGIILLSLVLMSQHGGLGSESFAKVLPVLGIYTVIGYRLLPALQAIYASLTQIRFGEAILEEIQADLALPSNSVALVSERPVPLVFNHKIEASGLCYSYDVGEAAGVFDIDLSLPAGNTLGIVGSTGSGKTTLVNLFLGLLVPNSGKLTVDGIDIFDENISAWRSNIGYVPQDIFLVDASISQNIAFGVLPEKISLERVRECAKIASIFEYIETELPKGFESTVGERGARLSGGQRQRIGIARALYHDPEVLIFDEATSALDMKTEKEVVDSIRKMMGEKTIIIVAHRISTVRDCDQIAVLENGRIAGLGTFKSLYEKNDAFRRIVVAGDAGSETK